MSTERNLRLSGVTYRGGKYDIVIDGQHGSSLTSVS
jgi:hypothetical protein